jgi:hypothetical protein
VETGVAIFLNEGAQNMFKARYLLALVLAFFFGCKEEGMKRISANESRLDGVPQGAWESLAQKRIFFGHQSVGQNILDGLKELMASHPAVQLDIRETSNPQDFEKPIFGHTLVGKNKNPKFKIDHFRKILDDGVGQLSDIAFLKLCFVDIDRNTDIENLFKYYDETVRFLTNKYPNLRIITITVPLTIQPPGLKAMVKKILGRYPWIREDNIKRNKFNDLLCKRYGKNVYDLADRETTSPSGEKTTFSKDGSTFYLLNRTYTDDGGHLNKLGRRVVAADLLGFLADLCKR